MYHSREGRTLDAVETATIMQAGVDFFGGNDGVSADGGSQEPQRAPDAQVDAVVHELLDLVRPEYKHVMQQQEFEKAQVSDALLPD